MRATQSVRVFGVYLIILGLALMVIPNLVLAPFGIPPTPEVWLRVVGVLVSAIGYLYLVAAHNALLPFYRATVAARTFVFLSFAIFVLLKLAHPALALFGAVDVAGAAWTFFTLRAAERS